MTFHESWGLEIDPSVFKTLKKFPQKNSEAVLFVIKLLPENPYFGDIQKMKGENNAWRRRIGSYRIFYKVRVQEKIILVFKIERRTSNTY